MGSTIFDKKKKKKKKNARGVEEHVEEENYYEQIYDRKKFLSIQPLPSIN